MTTIYELEKQATPGPVTAIGPVIHTTQGQDCVAITDVQKDICVPRLTSREIHNNNARLLAHCRNYFMEALEALKHAHTSLRTFTDAPNWMSSDQETLKLLEQTITNMETMS